ncbi:MAG TPA: DUF1553 domain-containing protein [Planctomycetota bacterium]
MRASLLPACSLLLALGAFEAAATAQVPPFEMAAATTTTGNRIDALVGARLQQLGIATALPCSDEVFVRRAFLDVTGTLPTAAEARWFLQDRAAGKRAALIEGLLQRPAFADYQAMRWCDLLRVKAEFPINLWPNAVQAYERWIHESLRQNVPYDRFVRALLLSSGSNFRVPEVNFFRAVQEKTPSGLAKAVALTFLGARYERWPDAAREGLEACFAKVAWKGTQEWKEEIVLFDPDRTVGAARTRGAFDAVLPDGSRVTIAAGVDPRTVFADWLLGRDNLWLARVQCNRIWCWLLGRGIVHEPDDFRADNEPANPELLDWLARELIDSGFDQRHVFRLILLSATWQRSSIPASRQPAAAANFAHYAIRRLEAEVLIDAICQITGTTEEYSSPIPEPFTFLPRGQRAIALGDGSTTSAFLELFGRPPRDTGLGQERNNQLTTAQRLHLLNSSHLRRKLQNGPGLAALLRGKQPRRAAVELWLAFLSRFPTQAELDAVQQYAASGVANERQVAEDVAWALLNSAEFLYRH